MFMKYGKFVMKRYPVFCFRYGSDSFMLHEYDRDARLIMNLADCPSDPAAVLVDQDRRQVKIQISHQLRK